MEIVLVSTGWLVFVSIFNYFVPIWNKDNNDNNKNNSNNNKSDDWLLYDATQMTGFCDFLEKILSSVSFHFFD